LGARGEREPGKSVVAHAATPVIHDVNDIQAADYKGLRHYPTAGAAFLRQFGIDVIM
jgi:hypothetical protein